VPTHVPIDEVTQPAKFAALRNPSCRVYLALRSDQPLAAVPAALAVFRRAGRPVGAVAGLRWSLGLSATAMCLCTAVVGAYIAAGTRRAVTAP
jgi:hypothetical protein